MKNICKKAWQCVYRATYDMVMKHDGIEHAGYLAFLGLLALFPFLVFLVSVIGFMGQGASGAEFISSLLRALPEDITAAIKPRITEIISGPPQGLLTVSILGAIWTASSAVEGVRTVLNRAYRVTTPPAYPLRRLLSIAQLVLFTSILIIGMLVVVSLPLITQNIEEWTGISFLRQASQELGKAVFYITIFFLFLAVSFIYYLLPNIKQKLMSVFPGAFIVVLLWIGAAWLFTGYLSHFDQVNLIYGSLGGIIAALVFFYISNIIFIFGAELNHHIAEMMGIGVVEKEATPSSNVDSISDLEN
ncbi:MAG: YihY/virulence factor BrkB family protein [Rickettsiales bacterium]